MILCCSRRRSRCTGYHVTKLLTLYPWAALCVGLDISLKMVSNSDFLLLNVGVGGEALLPHTTHDRNTTDSKHNDRRVGLCVLYTSIQTLLTLSAASIHRPLITCFLSLFMSSSSSLPPPSILFISLFCPSCFVEYFDLRWPAGSCTTSPPHPVRAASSQSKGSSLTR